jgi:hypothetical protein
MLAAARHDRQMNAEIGKILSDQPEAHVLRR